MYLPADFIAGGRSDSLPRLEFFFFWVTAIQFRPGSGAFDERRVVRRIRRAITVCLRRIVIWRCRWCANDMLILVQHWRRRSRIRRWTGFRCEEARAHRRFAEMSCASTFSHSLIPRYRMVTAQFEQCERHQQTGHEPTRNHALPLVMSRSCSIIRAVSKRLDWSKTKIRKFRTC